MKSPSSSDIVTPSDTVNMSSATVDDGGSESSMPEGFEVAQSPANSSKSASIISKDPSAKLSTNEIQPENDEDIADAVPELSPSLGIPEPRPVYHQYGSGANRYYSAESARGSMLGSGLGSVVGSESNRSGYFHNRAV